MSHLGLLFPEDLGWLGGAVWVGEESGFCLLPPFSTNASRQTGCFPCYLPLGSFANLLMPPDPTIFLMWAFWFFDTCRFLSWDPYFTSSIFPNLKT